MLSGDARKTRRDLPPDLRPVLDDIEAGLTMDPNTYASRLIPVSMDGRTQVYKHPNPQIEITFQVDEKRKVIYFFHYSAPAFRVRETIFISYSHKDRRWLEEIRKFLNVLEQKGVIRFWDDSQIEPGVPWENEIKSVLDTAKAGLLLVSQEFLTSKFIEEIELPTLLADARKKGKRIFWLHLSPSTVFEDRPEITRFQSLMPDPRETLEELSDTACRKALVDVSKALANAIA